MSNRQLSLVLVTLLVGIAAGFLFLLLTGPSSVPVEKRLTDVAAERQAGHLPDPNASGGGRKVVEAVNIEGNFETFDGTPGPAGANWPGFRGALADNVCAKAPSLAEAWPEGGPPVLWSVPLGEGHGGAAVWDGCVYMLDYDEEREGDALRCFSLADGKEIWRRWYRAPTKRNHGVSRTVPAVNEDIVVSVGPRCHVLCVDRATGDYRWGVDMVEEYGATVPLWYTGQCPLLDGDTVVLAPSGQVMMLGVDWKTGNVLWQTPNDTGWKMSHSSIMKVTLLGKAMYVYCTMGGIVGVSAEEEDRGTMLWKNQSWSHSVLSPSPVAVDDHRLFLTAGYGGGSMMLSVSREGDAWDSEVVYKMDKTTFACEQQTPIYYQGHLFGVLPKDAGELRGQFACLNPEGNLAWTSGKTDRFGLGPFLVADEKVFLLDDNGELSLLRASTESYELLARAKVLPGHDAWGPMALVDDKLLLRDSKTLMCLKVGSM